MGPRPVQGGGTAFGLPGTGAALRLLAATADAKAVAEIGTGTGVSGIHLLHGMRPDGVLTTVDPEADRQAFARQAFRAAGFAGNRARFIPGRALDVLPRSPTAGTTWSSATGTPPSPWTTSRNRCGCCGPAGWCASRGLLGRPHGRLRAQPVEVLRVRELLRTVRESPALEAALLPVGDGLLCAVRR